MYFNVNTLKQIEPPKMVLKNPDGEELFLLTTVKSIKGKYNLVDISEITFEAVKYIDKQEVEYYSYLENKRKVQVEGIGEFVITNISENNNGFKKYKTVTMKSSEYELSYDSLYDMNGTYQLYSWVKPEGTILHEVIKIFPDWKVGVIDDDIFGKYRTFEADEVNVYQWLMGDVSKAYECIFVFDTVNKTISAHTVDKLVEKTDIYLTFDNLLKSADIDTSSEDIYTVLDVKGEDSVSINRVNPMGDSRIYNFGHYKNEKWMNPELITAINRWEEKVKNYKPSYAEKYTKYLTNNDTLLTLNVELEKLQGEKKNWETVKEVREEQGLDYKDIEQEISKVQVKINAKEQEINTLNTATKAIKEEINNIIEDCSFETNFTEQQHKSIKSFISRTTYENTSFIYTSAMTEQQKQQMCEDLMAQGEQVLNTSSRPKNTFSIESVNFLTLTDYDIFAEQFKVGCEITLNLDDGIIAHPVCLSIEVDYENTSSFNMGFSEDLRLRNSIATYGELFGQIHSLSTSANGKASSALSQNYRMNERLNHVYEGMYKNADDIFITHETLNGQLIITNEKVLEAEAIINANKAEWDKIKDITNDMGNVITERLEGSINAGANLITNTESTVIFDNIGILARDNKYDQHAKMATRLSSAGLLIANSKNPDGSWNWRTAITGSGISADEINTGTLSAITIDGVTITGTEIRGGTITAGTQISAPSIVGGVITSAQLNTVTLNAGTLNAMEIGTSTLVGNTITGGKITGAILNIGNGRLTSTADDVSINLGNGKLVANNAGVTIKDSNISLTARGGKSVIKLDATEGIKIQQKSGTALKDVFYVDTEGEAIFKGKMTGGSLAIGNNFSVDTLGNCTVRSITITGAKGTVDANDLTIRNLVVGGNVTMGANATISWSNVSSKPNDLAYQDDIPTNGEINSIASNASKSLLSSTYGITSTTIGKSSISSPSISGGTITGSRLIGGTITQESTDSRYSDGELIGGRLQFKKGGSYYGAVMGDAQDGKMWLEGNNALKLNAVEGDISINPRSKYGETANGTIYLYGRVVVRGGEIVDENNVPITGSAKFG